MNSEFKRIENAVNVGLAKPVTCLVYALVLAGRSGYRTLRRCGRWLRRQWSALGEQPGFGTVGKGPMEP